MTNEQIRERLEKAPYKGILNYFENEVGEIVFFGDKSSGYFMHPKCKQGFYENLLTTIGADSINGLALFMQGVVQSARVRKEFKDEETN